ncbi:MAG TPA: hypothetical protein VJT71_20045 [Pyrinomonadaceae bacterium]|nr:hypothetical protein [Pyrinomonadaceae bacterium]
MKKNTLRELAKNPNFISGIYNYCDRWCERCQFTSRCFLYATEQDDPDLADPETRDISNEKFWRKMQTIFQETAELISEWAAEAGVDLDAVDSQEAMAQHDREMKAAEESELSQAARDYAFTVQDWFKKEFADDERLTEQIRKYSDTGEEALTAENAIEVIRWYQFFIAAKTFRAMTGADSFNLDDAEDDELLPDIFCSAGEKDDEELDDAEIMARSDRMDANGSAKVTLIAVDRSISAWRSLQLSLPAKMDSIKPLLIDLELLRRSIEARFPRARDFVRPGLDEVLSDFVS